MWEASVVRSVERLSLGIHVVGGLRVGVEPFLQPLVEGEEEEGGQLGFLQEVIHKAGDTISKGCFVQRDAISKKIRSGTHRSGTN